MRLIIGARGEIGLVGRDQRQRAPVGDVEQRRLRLRASLGEPVALQFEIERPGKIGSS